MSNYTKFKAGDIVALKARASRGMLASAGARAIVLLGKDDRYCYVNWIDEKANGQADGGYSEDYFEAVPAAPSITPLDDAGRAALKAGDRVLIEVRISGDLDSDGELPVNLLTAPSGKVCRHSWATPATIYALLPPAPKPIAAGDTVRILGGAQTGKAIGQASDGSWAVEYEAGDSINISRYDASALEAVS